MDEYIRAAQDQLDIPTNAPTAVPGAHVPTIAPTVPQIVVNTMGQQPTATPITSNFYSRLWLYICIGFVFLLMTYVSVQYAKDVRNRDVRNKRHNLHAYVDYSMSLANRLPNGHTMPKVMRSRVYIQHTQSDSSDTDSEQYQSDDDYVRAK
jgi:hypothetical protein